MPRKKTLDHLTGLKVEHEVRMLLHAGRDCMRNQRRNTATLTFDVNNPYYAEAFGIMRALALLGYGTLDSCNVPAHRNLRRWLAQLEEAVLREEGYGSTNQCDYCLATYGKDSVRRKTG